MTNKHSIENNWYKIIESENDVDRIKRFNVLFSESATSVKKSRSVILIDKYITAKDFTYWSRASLGSGYELRLNFYFQDMTINEVINTRVQSISTFEQSSPFFSYPSVHWQMMGEIGMILSIIHRASATDFDDPEERVHVESTLYFRNTTKYYGL